MLAFDATSKSALSTTSANFSWSHNVNTDPNGVLIYMITPTDVDNLGVVTYGGVVVPQVAEAIITAVSELGRCHVLFLGAGVPVDDPATILVTRSGTTGMIGMAATVFGSTNTEIYLPGVVIYNTLGTTAEASVTDGSPGTNSLRFAGGFHGDVGAAIGANSTMLQSNTLASGAGFLVRETTVGQGARPVGVTSGASDERAMVSLAVREAGAAAAASVQQVVRY
jgi:hypothetical protein